MLINNQQLNPNEANWISKILSQNFVHRNEIVNQINKSDVIRNYTKFDLSINFINKGTLPINSNIRVPVEMRVYKQNKPPIQTLLHVVNGFVNEIEIFFADSSQITTDIDIDVADIIDIIIDESLK